MEGNARQFRLAYGALALLGFVAVAAFLALIRGPGLGVAYAAAAPLGPPSAHEFEGTLAGTANAFAVTHGSTTRVLRAHCVQGSVAGHYMCAYTVERPNRSPECHLMTAEWQTSGIDSYVVTMSGRARRCDSVRDAILSLD